MKFHQHITTPSGEIWIADAAENNFAKLEMDSRQEFEARFLHEMLSVLIENGELDHEENGAPFLRKHPDVHVSVSHSENWFAIYLSTQQSIGIDIETQYNRIEKTQQYFLSENERNRLQPSIDQLKICWGIKESVFKLFRGKINSLKEEVQVRSIGENQAQASCMEQNINLNYLQSENFTLVYTN